MVVKSVCLCDISHAQEPERAPTNYPKNRPPSTPNLMSSGAVGDALSNQVGLRPFGLQFPRPSPLISCEVLENTSTQNLRELEAGAGSCWPRANVHREVGRGRARVAASGTGEFCGSLISTEPREAQAQGRRGRENPVRDTAPRDSKPECPMQPPPLQPQAKPPRETAPPSPWKPTPRGGSPACTFKRTGVRKYLKYENI